MRPVVSARLNTSVWSTSWPISSYLGINLSRSFQVHRTNKIGNVRTILPWGVFMQPLLQWKNDKYCIFWAYVCSIRYPALSPLACPHLQYFSTLSYTRGTFFEKKKSFVHEMCVLILSTTFVWNISHSKKNWARYDQKCAWGMSENINLHFRTVSKFLLGGTEKSAKSVEPCLALF